VREKIKHSTKETHDFYVKTKIRKKIIERRKIHYNLPVYKDYRDCVECLRTRVDFKNIGKVLVRGPERRSR